MFLYFKDPAKQADCIIPESEASNGEREDREFSCVNEFSLPFETVFILKIIKPNRL